MNLPSFIEQVGDEKAAKLFRVKIRTAKSWRLKERRPKDKHAEKVIKGSNGMLDYESIYSYPLKKGRA